MHSLKAAVETAAVAAVQAAAAAAAAAAAPVAEAAWPAAKAQAEVQPTQHIRWNKYLGGVRVAGG